MIITCATLSLVQVQVCCLPVCSNNHHHRHHHPLVLARLSSSQAFAKHDLKIEFRFSRLRGSVSVKHGSTGKKRRHARLVAAAAIHTYT